MVSKNELEGYKNIYIYIYDYLNDEIDVDWLKIEWMLLDDWYLIVKIIHLSSSYSIF